MARLIHRVRTAVSPIILSCALLVGIGVSDAKAGFIGYYSPGNFTLINVGGGVDGEGFPTANGKAEFPDLFTLVLWGMSDGSALDGWTDLTVPAMASGAFQFHYVFTTDDIPGTQYAGYLVGNTFVQLSDTDGAPNSSGYISVSVTEGDLIGFRAGGDNQGGLPAVLTVTEFSAPVPEPAAFQLLLVVVGALGARTLYRHKPRRWRS